MPKKQAKKQNKKIDRTANADAQHITVQNENAHAKKIMWFSVIIFTVAIAVLWGWSLKIRLANLNFNKSPEGQLLQKTQQNWEMVFTDQQSQQVQDQQKQTIKNNLDKIITGLQEVATSNTTSSL